jgi:site-specific recombinase XerC
MSAVTLDLPCRQAGTAQWAAVAFAASYSSPGTRQAYATQLRLWFDWCAQHQLEPLADVRRPHVELYARDLEARGLAPATVALKLVVITGFYRYCVEEQLLEHSPAVHVRRPKVAQESTRLGPDRSELGAFLVQAGLSGGNDHVLACLLALNALRVSEACGADLSDLALANGHRTLRIVGKGNQPALIPLAPRTMRDPPWVRWRLSSLDSNRLAGLRWVKVGGLVLGRGDVAERAVEALGVEPSDPAECGELEVIDAPPRALRAGQLGLVERVDGLGQRVVERVADRSDRGQRAELSEPLAVAQRRKWLPASE